MSDLSSNETREAEYLLGLFGPSHLEYELLRKPDDGQPTLLEMTKAALRNLRKSPDGFFLLLEG